MSSLPVSLPRSAREKGDASGVYCGNETLFAQLGGAATLDAAVDIYYRHVLNDPYIVSFFGGANMEKQAARQKMFMRMSLTMTFGGPHLFTGKDMREGHKDLIKMGMDDSHFDHILTHLRSTLVELDVDEALISQVIASAESMRDDVLDR